MSTKYLCFLNFKGGTGKTTSVSNIAAALAGGGYKTLMIDLDPQHNLTQSTGAEPEANKTVYHALTNKVPLHIEKLKNGVHIAANDLNMIKFELEAAAQLRREYILQSSLSTISENYDYILFDCPPSLGLVTAQALFAANDVKVIVPVEAEFFALKGFTVLRDALKNIGIGIHSVFVTKYDKRKILNRSVYDAVQGMEGIGLKATIRQNIAIAEAPAKGKDIFDYDPNSNGAKDYFAVTKELIKKLQ